MDAKLEAARKKGRNGDTILAHISPEEALTLVLNGGSGKKNPKTGLPEFNIWDSVTSFFQAPARMTAQALGSITGSGDLENWDDRMRANEESGDWGATLNSAVDPTQTTNALAAKTGKILPEWMKSGVLPAAVDLIAAYVGGPPGVAATSGLVSQFNDENPNDAWTKAGVKAGAAYLGGKLLSGIGSPGNTPVVGGDTALAEGVGEGATGITATTPLIAEAAPAAAGGFTPEELALAENFGGATQYGPAAAGVNAAPATSTPWTDLPLDEFSTPATPGATPASGPLSQAGNYVWDAAKGAMKYVGNNKMTTLMALNMLSGLNQAGMMQGVNDAQQESYDKYLNAINPPESVKATRFGQLAENARTQGTLAQKSIDESLAMRGVRGKGLVAPTGDRTMLTKDAINNAFNSVYGSYNVPGSPGPADYAPSALQLGAQGALQGMTQAQAMQWLLNNANKSSIYAA